jgi:Caspase domain/SIR2-like domain
MSDSGWWMRGSLGSGSGSEMSEKRFALVVATSEYDDPEFSQLLAPAQDADALADVLRNPSIGGYQVTELRNEPSSTLQERIETFFWGRARDDLLLLYFSCHGLKDKDGKLYFVARNTRRNLPRATSVPASFIHEVMDASDSRRQVLILDCCFSGAFSRGMQIKSGSQISLREDIKGNGRAVFTASDAIQYAFVEGEGVQGHGARSVFTRSLVDGLKTGEADLDFDNAISVDELHSFLTIRVRERSKNQTPMLWLFGLKGDLVLADSPVFRLRRRPSAIPKVSAEELDKHCRLVAHQFVKGAIIPVLGGDTNLCGRPESEPEDRATRFPPTEEELAAHLAERLAFPSSGARDLMSVADYVADYGAQMLGEGFLYRTMRQALDADYAPNQLHELLARLPRVVRRRESFAPLVVLTTNYDNALEQAFAEAGEHVDLIVYSLRPGRRTGIFIHYPPDGEPRVIERPNKYAPSIAGAVIVKLRGGVDRANRGLDTYVLTQEDHFSNFASGGADIDARLPLTVRERLSVGHLLFLGQSARRRGVWTLLNGFLGFQTSGLRSWAIQTDPDLLDVGFWRSKDVELLNVDLAEYAEAVSKYVDLHSSSDRST